MNYKKTFLFFIAALLWISVDTSAQTPADTSAHGQEDSARIRLRLFRQSFKQELPSPIGYVNDYEQLFTLTERKSLDSLILAYENKTTVQMTIVTLDTTMLEKDSLEVLTLHILRTWGVGQKESNSFKKSG